MKNRILERKEAGEKSVGIFCHLNSLQAVEVFGHGGLDYVILDTEHSSCGMDTVTKLLAAAQGVGLSAVVRINEISRSAVLRPLDLGAAALIVPNVETVEQVEQLVDYAKFPPLGRRGYCPTRDAGYGFSEVGKLPVEEYMALANKKTLLIPQCETLGCLEHIEEIAAMPGVDGIFVGPFDLSIALGKPCQFDAPEVVEAIDRVVQACKKYGKIAMIFTGNGQVAKERLAQGFDSVAAGVDVIYLGEAVKKLVRESLES